MSENAGQNLLHPSLPTVLTANETGEKTGAVCAPLDTRYKHHCPHAARASLQLQCSSKVRTLSPFVTVMK